MTKKKTEYSESFKAKAIAKIRENQNNISQAAKELGIPMNTLANLHRKAESGVLVGTQNYNPELIAALDEIKDLKKQLKIAQEEREILKKATAYFANEEGQAKHCFAATQGESYARVPIAKYAFMQKHCLS